MTTRELQLVARIADLESRLKRAHNRFYLQRRRAQLWRHRAIQLAAICRQNGTYVRTDATGVRPLRRRAQKAAIDA